MQTISLKTGFLALTLIAIASTGEVLTACSANTASNPVEMQGEHDGMNHSMEMALGPADAEYDLRFIDAMRLHHRGAIAMAKEAEQKSQRPEIKNLARNIIRVQNREENELLRKWRQDWYPEASDEFVAYGGEGQPTVPMSKEMQQNMSMLEDLGAADTEFDLRFIEAMTAHHQGAIAMAQDALQKSQRPEIKQLAREITTSQQTEIDQMQRWRQAWYQK